MIATRLRSAQPRSRTSAVWREVFERSGINKLPRVAELCPGNDPKVAHALLDSGFMGKAELVDLSKERLSELRSELGPVPFTLQESIEALETFQPTAGAVVANHPVDDLALSFFALKQGLTYEALYSRFRRDPEFSRQSWRMISNDREILESTVSLLCALARKCPSGAFFMVSQYQSKYEKAHSMVEETEFCSRALSEISRRLTADLSFLKLPWQPESAAGAGLNPRDWLLLRKASFRSLEIRLTRRCNLRCRHCCAYPFENIDIRPELAAQIAERYSIPGIKIGFTGGEPFLHRDLGRIIESFAGRGTRLSITTNGTVKKPGLVSLLASLGVKVKVSIHGSARAHDDMTGAKGSFRKSLRTIMELVRAGAEVAIQTSIHAKNVSDAIPRIKLCNSLGVRELKVFPLIDQGRARESSWDGARLEDGEFRSLVLAMADEGARLGVNVRTMEWPNNGQYVLISPTGQVSANPVDGGSGSLVFGHVSANPESLWQAYPFKDAHLGKYHS